MTTILIIVGIAFVLSEIGKGAKAKRIKREQESIRAEQSRIKEEQKRQREWAKQETARRIAIEREQIAQRKEQERIAKEVAKHEEQIAKMQYQLDTATEDIYNILQKIEEQQKYAKYLMEQRDKYDDGSADYFKWQNKLSVVDDKIYRLYKQRSKAAFLQEQAQRKLTQ